MQVGAAFEDPGVTRVRVEAFDESGELRYADSLPAVDGVLSADAPTGSLTDNAVNTLAVRALSEDGTQTGPTLECPFLMHRAPTEGLMVLPVLADEAVYPGHNIPRGGVGVPGAFVVAGPVSADAVSFAYGTTTSYGVDPTEWTIVTAAENVVIPFVPAVAGTQYLEVAEVDETGLIGTSTYRTIEVAEPGAAQEAPPVVSISEPEDTRPGDGMIPLRLTLTNDLRAVGGPAAVGEVTLRNGATELTHTSFDTRVKDVLVRESQVGTGFRDIRVEYVQYPGADTIVEPARICAASCAFTGGTGKVTTSFGTPTTNPHLEARATGFSPAPLSYTYQWFRDGKAISRATKALYVSPPTDEGHRIAVKVTAHGPRMVPRSVTSTAVLIGDRDPLHVNYGVMPTGARWNPNFSYAMQKDGETAGIPDNGATIEALLAEPSAIGYTSSVSGPSSSADIWFEMKGYVEGRGWVGVQRKDHNYYVGSVGENRRLEAFHIDVGGPVAPYYDVWYRTYTPKHGWLGWAKNGENAGTTGYGYRLEAVQIRVLPKGKQPTASGTGNAPFYNKATQNQVTVQPYLRPTGWKTAVHGGSTAGLVSTTQRLNAVRVDVDGVRYSGGVQVSAKVEGDGWRAYVGDTKVAGTYHRTDRTSAYKMRLTGEMAKQYDIYYRVHVAGTGWLGWAKNGAGAGTEPYKYRNTAVQVVLVKKGERPLMSGYGRAAYKR